MLRGRVDIVPIPHRRLRNNPLGDPWVRRIPIYLPPSYRTNARRRFPVCYVLAGFSGTGETHLNVAAWSETLPERIDRLIRQRRIPETVFVMADGATRYGGSQYINSSATGRYMDALTGDLVPWIDRHVRTIPKPTARAIFGKSSGGFGALTIAMRRPGVFGRLAAQSSDMYFPYCFLTDFPRLAAHLACYGGRLQRLLRAWRTSPNPAAGEWHPTIMQIAMASCYSPNPKVPLGFDLPIDPRTGAIRPAVWRRWLAWDPAVAVDRYRAALRRLRVCYLEVGRRDEYHLQYGHRMFVEKLQRFGIRHRYEEFDGGHRGTNHRLDRIFPILLRGL